MGGYVSEGLSLASLVAGQQQARRAARAQAEQVAAQNQYLMQQQAIRARQQRDLLARQMASARARLAAGGMGVGGGSGQALLTGMVRNTEADLADENALVQSRATNAANSVSSVDGLQQGLELARKGWNILGPHLG